MSIPYLGQANAVLGFPPIASIPKKKSFIKIKSMTKRCKQANCTCNLSSCLKHSVLATNPLVTPNSPLSSSSSQEEGKEKTKNSTDNGNQRISSENESDTNNIGESDDSDKNNYVKNIFEVIRIDKKTK